MPADCSYVNAVNIGIIIEQSLRLNVKRARRQQQKKPILFIFIQTMSLNMPAKIKM